jgi:hypothetical protein
MSLYVQSIICANIRIRKFTPETRGLGGRKSLYKPNQTNGPIWTRIRQFLARILRHSSCMTAALVAILVSLMRYRWLADNEHSFLNKRWAQSCKICRASILMWQVIAQSPKFRISSLPIRRLVLKVVVCRLWQLCVSCWKLECLSSPMSPHC